MESLYVTIKDELLKLIDSHVYSVGSRIPSEDELAEAFGVSRPTVRRAVQMLVDMGRLERRPYHGTIVIEPKIEQGYATVLRSFNDEMRDNNKVPKTTVILARKARAVAEVALRLQILEDTGVFKLVRLRYADDVPNVVVVSYIPLDLYPGITSVDFETTTLYGYFESVGNPVVRAHRRLEVLKADKNLSALIDVPLGDPIYRFTTVASTESGRIAEYAIANYRGESNAFEFDTTLTRVGELRRESRDSVLRDDFQSAAGESVG
ncbi:GntR family transcriptional regulator [Olsenella uli]|uniref:GntR family transcriptional regulator n=1 Tax=Olsenella uli TaxID=133926 RepID=UPI0012AB72D8|nr:GntR family transcriptional regulator [Olsenella uli]